MSDEHVIDKAIRLSGENVRLRALLERALPFVEDMKPAAKALELLNDIKDALRPAEPIHLELSVGSGDPSMGLPMFCGVFIMKQRGSYTEHRTQVTCETCRERMPPILHILKAGHSLCQMNGTPGDWPTGHRWVDENGFFILEREPQDQACIDCMSILAAAYVTGFFKGDIDKAERWMRAPNFMFGGYSAQGMFELGKGAKVLRWMKQQLAGEGDIMADLS